MGDLGVAVVGLWERSKVMGVEEWGREIEEWVKWVR